MRRCLGSLPRLGLGGLFYGLLVMVVAAADESVPGGELRWLRTALQAAGDGATGSNQTVVGIPGLAGGAKRLELVGVPGRGEVKSFLMGMCEMTQAQYEAIMGRNPSCARNGADYPVEKVSWTEAKEFCSQLQARLPAGAGRRVVVRLPTDAEWSLAVGLPEESTGTPQAKHLRVREIYPWGGSWPPPVGAGNYEAGLKLHSYEGTSPVGSFKPNPLGFYDLGGNVWEWCEDWYDGERKARVLRGASWANGYADYLLSSHRGKYAPDDRDCSVGFRVVVALPATTIVPQPK